MDSCSAEPFVVVEGVGLGFADRLVILVEHMPLDNYCFGIVVLSWDHFNEQHSVRTWPF